MDPSPPRSGQPLCKRAGDQRVGERVSIRVGRLPEQAGSDGSVTDLDHSVFGSFADLCDQLDVELPPYDRANTEHELGIGPEQFSPMGDDIADGLRKAMVEQSRWSRPASGAVVLDRSCLGEVAEQFDDEEGVA